MIGKKLYESRRIIPKNSTIDVSNQSLDKKWVIPQDKIADVIKKAHKLILGLDLSKGGKIIEIQDIHSTTSWKLIALQEAKEILLLAIDNSMQVGKGAQGEVVLAQNVITRSWAAVKIIKPILMNFEEDVKREKSNLERCNRLLGTAVDANQLAYIVMDYYSGVNLQDYLYETDSRVSKELPEHYLSKKPHDPLLLARLVEQVLAQIIWLHSKGLAHRDIKLENLVVDPRGEEYQHLLKVMLVDLGTAVDLSKERVTEIAGTFGYNDPHLVNNRGPYQFANDLHSVGVVLAAICSQHIYPAGIRRKLQEQREAGSKCELSYDDVRYLMPDMFTNSIKEDLHESQDKKTKRALWRDIKDIITHLTFEDPSMRPTLDQLRQMHVLFKTKVTCAIIEASVLNPSASLEKHKLHRRSLSSSSTQATLCTSSSNEIPRTTLSTASIEAPILRRKSGVFIPDLSNFIYGNDEKADGVPTSPKSARASLSGPTKASARKGENYPKNIRMSKFPLKDPAAVSASTASAAAATAAVVSFDKNTGIDKLTSLMSNVSLRDENPTPSLVGDASASSASLEHRSPVLTHRRVKSSGAAIISSDPLPSNISSRNLKP